MSRNVAVDLRGRAYNQRNVDAEAIMQLHCGQRNGAGDVASLDLTDNGVLSLRGCDAFAALTHLVVAQNDIGERSPQHAMHVLVGYSIQPA